MTEPTRSGGETRRAALSGGTQPSGTTDYRPSSPDSSAAQDRAEGAQRLAEGEQAARGAAEPPRENLARSTGGSSPDAGSAATSSWEETVRLTDTAPITPRGLAEDIIYAFRHGWINLPSTAGSPEAGERLTRLYAVKRHVETNRGR